MPVRTRDRRLPLAAVAIVGAALLGGCAYAEAGTLPATAPTADATAHDVAAVGAVGVVTDVALDARHGPVDVAFVSAALVHHRLSVRLGKAMRAETQAPATATELAEGLVADRGPDVATSEALLRLWGEPLPETAALPLADLGEVAGPLQLTAGSATLLEQQTDNIGVTPFWTLTVRTHEEALVGLAEDASRTARSSTVRDMAEDFLAERRVLVAALDSLTG